MKKFTEELNQLQTAYDSLQEVSSKLKESEVNLNLDSLLIHLNACINILKLSVENE